MQLSNLIFQIQNLIIDVLVMYTKPEFVPQDEEKLGQNSTPSLTSKTLTDDVVCGLSDTGTSATTVSCWCLMLQELFKHTLTVPHVSHVTIT